MKIKGWMVYLGMVIIVAGITACGGGGGGQYSDVKMIP